MAFDTSPEKFSNLLDELYSSNSNFISWFQHLSYNFNIPEDEYKDYESIRHPAKIMPQHCNKNLSLFFKKERYPPAYVLTSVYLQLFKYFVTNTELDYFVELKTKWIEYLLSYYICLQRKKDVTYYSFYYSDKRMWSNTFTYLPHEALVYRNFLERCSFHNALF